MEYREEDFLQLSGIQHFAFCRRQWALIHLEQQWQENLRTVEGHILHEKAHDAFFTEKRGNLLIARGLPVFSRTLGVSGACDVVEFHRSADGVSLFGREERYRPVPVEYKRGKPKEHRADELQLCCQAMCLEEMLLCEEIQIGYLYETLRMQVCSMLEEMHGYFRRGHTPKSKPGKQCKACSLEDICMPWLYSAGSVEQYIKEAGR